MTGARPLRVLVVTPKGFVGGAEKWLAAVLTGTSRIDARVIALDDGVFVDELRQAGIPTAVLATGPSGRDVAATSLRLRRELRRNAYDVVLANGIKAAAAVVPVARWIGVPVVWVRHDPNYDGTIGATVGRLADRVVVVAPPTADEQRRFDPIYVPPPLLAEPLDEPDARRRLTDLGVPDDGLQRVAMMCRLAEYKGVDTAIRALPAAAHWRLVVAGIDDPGDPGEHARLRRLAADLGVADRVSWLGEVPQAGRLAAAVDAVAILTRAGVAGYPDAEGFGMTLVEAYAAGIPVLADPRTVPPLRDDRYAGGAVEVDATDPRSVSAALLSLVGESAPVATDRATAARAAAAAHPRAADVADRIADVLAQAAFRPGAGRTEGPPISVVSTVFNEGAGVDVLVADVLAQAGPDDEFVVVDGGSSDDTVERLRLLAKDDHRLQVIEAEGAGISQGRNIGVRAARSDWIACTDAGCRLTPDWLAAFRAAAADGKADLVTGVYEADPGRHRIWETTLAAVAYPNPGELRRRTPLVRAYGALFGRVYDAGLPTGRSVAFTRDAWQAAGGYPEHLATAEDVTFGQAIVRSGRHAELAADAAVIWGQRDSLRANLRMFYRYGVGDGQSGDVRLIARNVIRAGAFGIGPVLLVIPRTRIPAALAMSAYVSLPMKRALAGPRPVATATAVPAIAAARDLSKIAGCVVGLLSPP